MYRAVPSQVELAALDQEVLRFWQDNAIFERSLEQTAERPEWVFYEGPPTANGMPGTHHIEARVFKDLFPRYRTMKGYHVARKAGWDCHGLPVELAVEKELGLAGKADVESYGVGRFNARCRESVVRHTDAFAELTRRMGYWVDMDDAYRTMDPDYIESVWWSLKQIFDRGLLVQDFRVAPWCPRDQTTLSDHELAQGYELDTDESAYVRLPLRSGPWAGRASLLVWTTTPWTLVSNTAVAVHPDVTYVVASDGQEEVIVARPLMSEVLDGEWRETGVSFVGAEMERWAYEPPFGLVEIPDAHYVILADYVTTDSGTGLVHQAPAFGADDLASCRVYGLPLVNPLRSDGTFDPELPLVGGMFLKTADGPLLEDLRRRGLLFRQLSYQHNYPHCWRCHTPLIYYAQPSWYVRTTQVRDALLRENEKTNWHPSTIKHGRFGDWLQNNVDWALSRSRYWGTPLPIWRCASDHLTCIGSLAELGDRVGRDLSDLDPHRPFIDEVTFTCHCGGEAVRVPEVIDAWYDSGAMPFAQFGYPHKNAELFQRRYPAQFISEAIDQTRGWFYTLMAVGTLVFDRSSFENVVCLGHILAEDGRKMSKHLGNILEPIPLMERYGADAVRWFMAAVGSPWAARRVGHAAMEEVVRKVLLTYWNSVSFHVLYARTAGWVPSEADPAAEDRPVLDRWLLSELNGLIAKVDAAYDRYETLEVGRLLSAFIDDLSNWYVRRSRRRFWRGDPSALATLHEALRVVTLLLAPVTPFVTERVWQDLVRPVTPEAPVSVHLAEFPVPRRECVDEALESQVAIARRLVELGRAARAESGMKTRQPLSRALVSAHGFEGLPSELLDEIAAELNVVEVTRLSGVGGALQTTVKAAFRPLGKRFGKDVQKVAAAIAVADADALASALRTEGQATVEVDGSPVALSADEVIVTETPRAGWAVATEAGITVALDLALTPELVRAGVARDVIRAVQDARKKAGLDVTDRIVLHYVAASADSAEAMALHGKLVADEVLATELVEGEPGWALDPVQPDDSLGLVFWLREA